MAGQPLVVKLTVDSAEFEKAMKDVKDGVVDLGGATKQGETGVAGMAKAFVVAQLAVEAFKFVMRESIALVKEGIQESIKQEQAELRFSQALAARGRLSSDALASAKALSEEIAKTTNFTDDAVLSTQRFLVSMANLSQQQVPAATRAIADLASGAGIDLEQATKLAARALAGTAETIRGTTIAIDQNLTQSERLVSLQDQIAAAFGGAAQAEARTFGGQVNQLTKSWGELLEEVGNFVTKNPLVMAALEAVTGIIQDLTESIKGTTAVTDALEGAFAVLIPVTRGLLAVVAGLASIFEVVMIAMNGIAMVAVKVAEGFQHIWSIGSFVTTAIGIAWEGMGTIIQRLWLSTIQSVLKGMSFLIEKAAQVAGFFNEDLGNAMEQFSVEALKASVSVGQELSRLKDPVAEIGKEWSKTKEEIRANKETSDEMVAGLKENVDAHVEGIGKIADAYVNADNKLARIQERAAEIQGQSKGKNPFGLENATPEAPMPEGFTPKGKDTGFTFGPVEEEAAHATRIHQEALDAIAAQRTIARDKKKLEDEADELDGTAAMERFKLSHEGMLLAAQEQRARAREQRAIEAQAEAEEQNTFLLGLADAFNATGNMAVDATLTMKAAFTDSFLAIARGVSDSVFAAIKGTQTIGEVFKSVFDSITKIVIDALVKMAAQWVINHLLGQQTAQSQLTTNIPLAASNALTSFAAAPFPIDIGAPAFAAAIGAQASAYAAAGKGAGLAPKEHGDEFIPETGPFLLHQGERVVTRDQNQDLTAFLKRMENDRTGTVTNVYVTVGELIGDQEHINRLADKLRDAVDNRNARIS